MDIKDIIVSTCAIVGAMLGVFNLARAYLTDAERLRVAVWTGDNEKYPSVEVVNVSPFPITVMEIGNAYLDGQVADVNLQLNDIKGGLPQRIEPRSSHTFRVSMHETIARHVYEVRYTFVKTALGEVFTNESRLARWKRRAMDTLHLKP